MLFLVSTILLLPYLFHFLRGHTARKASKYKGSWSKASDKFFDFGSMLPYSLQKLIGDNGKKANVDKGLRGKSSPRIFVVSLLAPYLFRFLIGRDSGKLLSYQGLVQFL